MTEPCWLRDSCRLCGTKDLRQILDLPDTPPANAFLKEIPATPDPVYPLKVNLCRSCGGVQLSHVVDPQILFADYLYATRFSPSLVRHFDLLAETCLKDKLFSPADLVLSVGTNDATDLAGFKKRGARVLGVDPSRRHAIDAFETYGITVWPEFFTEASARRVGEKAKIVLTANVFAHVDDLRALLGAIRSLLAYDGTWILEAGYWPDLLEKSDVSNIYQEHVQYHTVKALQSFLHANGMSVRSVERIPSHGGSIRATVVHGTVEADESVHGLVDEEVATGVFVEETYALLTQRLASYRDSFWRTWRSFLLDRYVSGQGRARAVGFTAPAKMTTLCTFLGLTDEHLSVIGEDSTWKVGRFTPGTHIPVVSTEDLLAANPDLVVVFAWDVAEACAKRLKDLGYVGKVLVPFPRAIFV